ncbi:MAG: Ig-like domain-containing protein, partial [Pseudomonadota bacterium]
DNLIQQIGQLKLDLPVAPSPVESRGLTQIIPDPDRYLGTVTITDPVPMGTMDLGFSFDIGQDNLVAGSQDNLVAGSLCVDCGPLFKASGDVAITGNYNPADRTITFSTDPMPREIAGRTANRTWAFSGQLSASGDLIEGSFTETITGFITRPVIAEGVFLVSKPTSIGTVASQPQLLVESSASIVERSGTVDLTILLRDSDGNPLAGAEVILAASRGSLSAQSGTTNSDGELAVTFTAPGTVGNATITARANGLVQTRTISVVTSAPPQTGADDAAVEAGDSVVIDILANDSGVGSPLDPSSVIIIDQPSLGTVTLNAADGSLRYTAAATSSGTDIFTYVVKDDKGVSSEATSVTVTVTMPDTPQSGPTIYLPIIQSGK